MNKKLKIALTYRYSDQGFAFPVAVGLGLIMILVAATMIARSHGDQTTASVQKATAQSLAVTEGGINRSLSKLKQLNNGFYLQLNYDTLNTNVNPQKTYFGADAVLNSGDEVTTAVDQWSSPPSTVPCATAGSLPSGLVSGSIGSGSYTIRAYRYRDPDGNPRTGDETGNLLIEGTQSSAESQIQVSIPVFQNAVAGSFPGLYASNSINLGNNDILRVTGGTGSSSANVICKDCVVPTNQCSNGAPTQAGLNTAVGRGANSEIEGNIVVSNPQLPPVPTAPATACSATSGPNCSIDISASSLGGNMTLPRATDITNRATWLATNPTTWTVSSASEPYRYVVSSIDISGNNDLTIDTTTAPVYIYLSGNVSLGGNGGIAHSGSPERLRLYGRPADANNANDQTITISGGSSASRIFIYAPDANVGINGGSNNPDILGAVWAKTWGAVGSNSNNADIQVPDNMPGLLGGSFSGAGVQAVSSGPPSTWQRQPISQ